MEKNELQHSKEKIWKNALTEFPKEDGYILAILQFLDSERVSFHKVYYSEDESYKFDKFSKLNYNWSVLVWRELNSEVRNSSHA